MAQLRRILYAPVNIAIALIAQFAGRSDVRFYRCTDSLIHRAVGKRFLNTCEGRRAKGGIIVTARRQ